MLSDEFSRDVAQCFFDLQEFGEAMKLNGKSVLVVADAEKLQQRVKKTYDGLVMGDLLLYISARELKKVPRLSGLPRAGEVIEVEEKPMTLVQITAERGVYELLLQYAGGRGTWR